jgi:hypothetical protein
MNMKFFSSHTIANTPMRQLNQMFMMPIKNIPIVKQNVEIVPVVTDIQQPQNTVKKVKWGEPTWFLLHTLSVKIKENEFQRIRTELLNNIYGICVNLPCPDCSNHAKTYLDNVNFNTIQTKADLIMLLYKFHNDVNKMKGYPQFPFEQLHEKYSLAITNNIIRNFMAHFSDRNRSKKLLATDLSRANLCNVLKNWFNMKIHAFDQ